MTFSGGTFTTADNTATVIAVTATGSGPAFQVTHTVTTAGGVAGNVGFKLDYTQQPC